MYVCLDYNRNGIIFEWPKIARLYFLTALKILYCDCESYGKNSEVYETNVCFKEE